MCIWGMKDEGWDFFNSGGDAFNVVKFFLGVCSIFFDSIFMFQHYVLYRKNADPDKIDTPLLNNNEAVNQSDDTDGKPGKDKLAPEI